MGGKQFIEEQETYKATTRIHRSSRASSKILVKREINSTQSIEK